MLQDRVPGQELAQVRAQSLEASVKVTRDCGLIHLIVDRTGLESVDCSGVQDEDGPEVPVWNPEDDNQDPPGDWWLE